MTIDLSVDDNLMYDAHSLVDSSDIIIFCHVYSTMLTERAADAVLCIKGNKILQQDAI